MYKKNQKYSTLEVTYQISRKRHETIKGDSAETGLQILVDCTDRMIWYKKNSKHKLNPNDVTHYLKPRRNGIEWSINEKRLEILSPSRWSECKRVQILKRVKNLLGSERERTKKLFDLLNLHCVSSI